MHMENVISFRSLNNTLKEDEDELWGRLNKEKFKFVVLQRHKDKNGSSKFSRAQHHELIIFQNKTLCLGKPEYPSHGHCVWDAAIVLSEYFMKKNYYSSSTCSIFKGLNVVELGAGIGLVGMTLSLLEARVVLTDQEYCLPLLQKNVDNNFSSLNSDIEIDSPQVSVLQWGNDMDSFVQNHPEMDLIVASDIIYNMQVLPLLVDTIDKLCVKQASKFFLCYESRNAFTEHAFVELLQQRSFHVSFIPKDKYTHDTAVNHVHEITILQASRIGA